MTHWIVNPLRVWLGLISLTNLGTGFRCLWEQNYLQQKIFTNLRPADPPMPTRSAVPTGSAGFGGSAELAGCPRSTGADGPTGAERLTDCEGIMGSERPAGSDGPTGPEGPAGTSGPTRPERPAGSEWLAGPEGDRRSASLRTGCPEMERTFGFWSLFNAVLFLHCSLFLEQPVIFSMTLCCLAVDLCYFGNEVFVHGSIPTGTRAALYPLFLSGTMLWMLVARKFIIWQDRRQDVEMDEDEQLAERMSLHSMPRKRRVRQAS